MQDTFQWTDETVREYAETCLKNVRDALLGNDVPIPSIEQFKSSKSPKKEWEIVAFKFEDRIYRLTNDDQYRDVNPAYSDGVAYFGLDYAFEPKNNCTIHSVRRLSDDWTVSVKDKAKNAIGEIGTIKSIDATGHILFENISGLEHITTIQKLPQPILTTVDGVEIRENEECWIVDKYYKLLPEPEKINEFKRNYYSNCFIFSTREAAEAYILDNRPLLSLNDVKNYVKAGESASFAIEKLTALVRQKLNQ